MDKQGLIDELKRRFFGVDETGMDVKGKILDGIKVWGIGVFDLTNGVITKKNLTFYTKEDVAYWGNFEPNPPAPVPVITFTDRVNGFIASEITDKTIKFAYIEQISDATRKALVIAVMSDKSEKKAIISEDTQGKFTLDQL